MPSKIQSPVHYSEVEPIHQFEACSFNSILFDQEPAGLPKSERIRKTKVSEPSASVAAPNFFLSEPASVRTLRDLHFIYC